MALITALILYVILGSLTCYFFSCVGEEYNEYDFEDREVFKLGK